MFTGILRWLLAALLLALGSSDLLAQQPNPGVAPPEAGEPRAALVPAVGAPTTVQTPQAAPQPNDLQRLAAGTVFRDCADCPEVVVIPPGIFTMGSSDNETGRMDREGPQHLVAIPGVFAVGKYEVTKAQFARFVQESRHTVSGGCFVWSGSKYGQDASKDWRNPGFAQTDDEPVVCVNWNDAKAYTEWLTKKTGKRYRLPTEAEWEYAARAGSQTSRPWGDNASDACRYANVADATAKRDVPGTASWSFHECNDNHAYTAPVGSYEPNAFGLYDMLGNAWEWTDDCLNEEYAGAPSDVRDRPRYAGAPSDGRDRPRYAGAPSDGRDRTRYAGEPSDGGDRPSGDCGLRVLRGGGWVDSPAFVRYDFRFFIGPDDRDFYIGFRVARTD